MPRISTNTGIIMEITILDLVISWYIIGLCAIIYTRHIKEYLVKKHTEVTLADILLLIVVANLGPILIIVMIVIYIEENKILTKTLIKFDKPIHKSDK